MEYRSKEYGDKVLLDHLATVCRLTRDYTDMDSQLLSDQWKKFRTYIQEWYDIGFISEVGETKALRMIDYLLHMKERVREYEETKEN